MTVASGRPRPRSWTWRLLWMSAVAAAAALMSASAPANALVRSAAAAEQFDAFVTSGKVVKVRSRRRHRRPAVEDPDQAGAEAAETPGKAPGPSAAKAADAIVPPVKPVSPVAPTALDHRDAPAPQPATTAPPSPSASAEWSPTEIATALRECVAVLAPTGAIVEAMPPLREGQCGTPAPVRLSRFSGPSAVEISPPVMVNCRIAAKLHAWVEHVLQPAAIQSYGAPVMRIVTLSSYDCRDRIGTTNQKISEHAFANAIDIAAVVMADGHSVDVLGGWGPSLRDTAPKPSATADLAHPTPPSPAAAAPVTPLVAKTASKRGAPAALASLPPSLGKDAAFLRTLHAGACKMFGTVLGPDANEAHRNHLHLDLAVRKHAAFCE